MLRDVSRKVVARLQTALKAIQRTVTADLAGMVQDAQVGAAGDQHCITRLRSMAIRPTMVDQQN